MTWDVPVKDNCPECGQTMFKKSGKGFKKPFCINAECPNFLPEDKRGYPKKKTDAEAPAEAPADDKPGKAAPAQKSGKAAKSAATAPKGKKAPSKPDKKAKDKTADKPKETKKNNTEKPVTAT
jgi:DNA topoisomerase-1